MNRLITGLSILILGLTTAAHGMIQPEFRDGAASSIVSSVPDSAGSSSVSLALSCRNNPIDLVDPLGLTVVFMDSSGKTLIADKTGSASDLKDANTSDKLAALAIERYRAALQRGGSGNVPESVRLMQALAQNPNVTVTIHATTDFGRMGRAYCSALDSFSFVGEGKDRKFVDKAKDVSSDVFFDPSLAISEGTLAHELTHAYDYMTGDYLKQRKGERYREPCGNTQFRDAEVHAMTVQNIHLHSMDPTHLKFAQVKRYMQDKGVATYNWIPTMIAPDETELQKRIGDLSSEGLKRRLEEEAGIYYDTLPRKQTREAYIRMYVKEHAYEMDLWREEGEAMRRKALGLDEVGQ